MPRLLIPPGLLVAVLGLLWSARPAEPIPAGRSFRVATWNAHMGVDDRGRYDLAGMAGAIAKLQIQLIGLQEMTRNHAGFNCDDQPATLARLLTEKTGRQWHHVYLKEWNTKKRECVESGRGDEHETEGLAFLAPEPLTTIGDVDLWNGRIGLAVSVPSAGGVPVIVTHLASGAKNLKDRVRQLEQLLPWATQRGPTRVLLGDFNASPEAPELQPVFAQYRDAWAEAARDGKTRGVRSGSTRPGRESRIDYVFYAGGLELDSVDVVDTSSPLGAEASDHRPVVATFRTAVSP